MKLPRNATHIAHGYTLTDIYNLAVYAVSTDHWRPTLEWTERVEAAWSAIATALCEADEAPRRRELVFIARDASQDVIAGHMRHRGIDNRGATFGETRTNFARFWLNLPVGTLEDRTVDELAMQQIWPRLKPDLQEALVALATHDDYTRAADALGLRYYTFCARISRARRAFLRLWHEGETPSTVWGNDKRQGRENSRTAIRVLAQRQRERKYAAERGAA